ncbi:MAG: UrcA family protein [Allosphingosinicella sp.]
MFKRTLSAIGAAALTGTVALAAPLHAAEPQAAVSVSFADLDLSKSADVSRLERRVKAAAGTLCNAGSRSLTMNAKATECQADVLAHAKTDIDSAIASARSGTVRLALRTR